MDAYSSRRHDTAIVVGTDGSPSATEAVRQAARIASCSGAKLHIVSAYSEMSERARAEARRDAPTNLRFDGLGDNLVAARAVLEDAAEAVQVENLRVRLHAVKASPIDAIRDVAERESADLIVVGNRGITSWLRRLRIPVCTGLESSAPCPVKVVDTSRFWRGSGIVDRRQLAGETPPV